MRPLRLRLSAFGPYPKTALIDFRGLGPNGLFLIHGATGAGKTSILDGISFALFGRASGADRTSEGLRSDLAPDDLTTEAILEFAIGTDVYRARRQPRQSIKKKRGEGLRTINPDGSLEKLVAGDANSDFDNGEWKLIESGEKKTDLAINELLGMSEEQFRQVVVLPQGQFRKFLAAGSDEREVLLARLFRTDRFQKIEDALEDRARRLAEQITSKRRTLESLLVSLEIENIDKLSEKLDEMNSRFSEITRLEPVVREKCEQTSRKFDAARDARAVFVELERAKEKHAELEANRSLFLKNSKRIEDERRARPVAEAHTRFKNLSNDIARLSSELEKAKEALELNKKASTWADADYEKYFLLKPEIESARSDRDRLKETYASVVQLNKMNEQASTLQKLLLVQQKDASIFDTTAIARTYNSAAERSVALNTALSFADSALKLLETDLKKAQLKYHQSEASRLALQLEDGKPCAVCGSTSHPKPASPIRDAPSRETIEELESSLTNQKIEIADIRLIAAKLESERASIEISVRKLGVDPTASERKVIALKSFDEARRLLKTNVEELRKDLSHVERQLELIEIERERKLAKVEETRRSFDAIRGSLDQLESSVKLEDRDLEGLKTRGQSLTKRIEEFDAGFKLINEKRETVKSDLAASLARTKTLEEESRHRDAELASTARSRDELLSKAGFSSLEACLASALSDFELNQLEKFVRDFERESSLNSAKITDLQGKMKSPAPLEEDLKEFERLKQEAHEVQTRLLAEKLHLENTLRTLASMRERITKLNDESRVLSIEHSKVGRLAEVAAGRHPNLSRVSFQRYVLASRLDEVLEQASRRLFVMSRGQFILRRSRSVEDKRRSAGLDVEVEDALSGKTRPTSSLSGGEGFLASLALAMGLSDVVQSHLGGVRLEAVFVDEGFGTLDPEALDLAMTVLSGLRSGGRLVGIISHVPELKDQIANRLVVRKGTTGSSVAWETSFV